MTQLRQPPLPATFNWRRSKGSCRWCGEIITRPDGSTNNRTSWHGQCLNVYFLVTRPETMRDHVWERCGGRCEGCGTDLKAFHHWRARGVRYRWYSYGSYGGSVDNSEWPVKSTAFTAPYTAIEPAGLEWHCDHIVPLWSVDRSHPQAWRAWLPANCRALCVDCHNRKTAEEAAQRAKETRIRIKRGAQQRKLRVKDLPF